MNEKTELYDLLCERGRIWDDVDVVPEKVDESRIENHKGSKVIGGGTEDFWGGKKPLLCVQLLKWVISIRALTVKKIDGTQDRTRV